MARKGSSRPQIGQHRAIVYKIDVWSVVKVSLPFYICAMATLVGLAVLFWGFLEASGTVDSFTEFVEKTGYSNFEFLPGQMFEGARTAGLILVVVGTVFNVVAVVIFNQLSGLLGGLQVLTVDKPFRRRRGDRA